MADATGLSLAELIIVNGFTDFIDVVHNSGQSRHEATPVAADNCTAFLVPGSRTQAGMALFGQTWDMHDSATEHVIMLQGRPAGKPAFLAFTTVGCIGMIGMNDAGISVGINNLLGNDGQAGVTWPFVIRRILEQENVEDALRCITEAKLAGAHNYLLLDAAGRGYNVEAMPTAQHITELDAKPLVHSNHCLMPATRSVQRPRTPASQASSEARLDKATQLLLESGVTVADLQELTREQDAICIAPTGPDEIATCGAAIMQPATREFWAVWGLPSENAYQRFSLAAG
jgi:isopenicillin-N N-acyltransferase-like protein